MGNNELKKEYRDRINHSDILLGGRTTAFLIGNGFLMTALGTDVGVEDPSRYQTEIARLGLMISGVWFLIGFQTRRSITKLHCRFRKEFPDDQVNNIVFSSLLWRHEGLGQWLGPTELLALWLPIFVFFAWVRIF